MAQTFERLKAQNDAGRYLCVGLDPNPVHVWKIFPGLKVVNGGALESYCNEIAEVAAQYSGMFKAQFACWARHPEALKRLFRDIRKRNPDIPLVLDGKFNDIGNTVTYWAEFALHVGADAVTANPYMGIEDVGAPFATAGIDVFFLASTSNKGSEDIQRMQLQIPSRLDERVACMVNARIGEGRPYGLVIGGTRPEDLNRVRQEAPLAPLLVPGIGAQGGDAEAAISILRKHPAPWVINVSRGIAEASQEPGNRDVWRSRAMSAARDYAREFKNFTEAA